MKRIGRYEIIRRLGKGGMGAVYKGIAPVIEKVVAIKLLQPLEVMEDVIGLEKLREIFIAEARTMASFQQPFLVTAHDFDEDEQGRPFFVMEYICKNLGEMIGEDFQVEKDSRIIQPRKVLHYGAQLLRALAFLHHRNIIHRDIKPQNILVTDEDTIKICDFGMALVEGTAFCGPENMQIGSPYYTPPEQRKNPLLVDGRADLYSAAVLLYRMLTGKFPGMQSFSLSLVNSSYDDRWDAFFRKALSWDPDERYQSAAEMLEAFEKLHLNVGEPFKGEQALKCELVAGGERPRSEPANICKSRAGEAFGVNEHFRPATTMEKCRIIQGERLVDENLGLAWYRHTSPYPLTQEQAAAFVRELNREKVEGLESWRLPTVNELLSLLGPGTGEEAPPLHSGGAVWLWSCDRHGNHEGWYVNLDMGYTGVQDINCLNYVLPVCSMSAAVKKT